MAMDRDAFVALFSSNTITNTGNTNNGRKAASPPNRRRGNSTRNQRAASITAKKASNKRQKSAAAGGSRFVQCPLCSKYFHSSLAQAHVEQCTTVAASTSVGEAEATKRGSTGDDKARDSACAESPAPPRANVSSYGSRLPSTGKNHSSVPAATTSGGISPVTVPQSLSPSGGQAYVANVFDEPPGAVCSFPVNSPPKKPTALTETSSCRLQPREEEHRLMHDQAQRANSVLKNTETTPSSSTICSNNHIIKSSSFAVKSVRTKTTTNNDNNNSSSSSSTKTDAFSTLMAASALANFREEIYIWGHEDGTLSWGWGTAGNPRPPPPPATITASQDTTGESGNAGSSGSSNHQHRRQWSCQVATKGPDGRKAGMCEVWTNIPSMPTTPLVPSAKGQQNGVGLAAGLGSGVDENSGVKASHPGQSLSRLPVPVIKSMLQKNVRRGRAEAAARCALELALKSWSDAIRRVLVIIVEDSLLHPSTPFLTWLMVATSKGYHPSAHLLGVFLCIVYETAACPVRDSIQSCRLRDPGTGQPTSFETFPAPHPKDLIFAPKRGRSGLGVGKFRGSKPSAEHHNVSLVSSDPCENEKDVEADGGVVAASTKRDIHLDGDDGAHAVIACLRRALLMRVSYGGMARDQALIKGACLAWGERCGHYYYCVPKSINESCGYSTSRSADGSVNSSTSPPPAPPIFNAAPHDAVPPFKYLHRSILSALEASGWATFLLKAHTGKGMPPALRLQLLAHVVGGKDMGGTCGGISEVIVEKGQCKVYLAKGKVGQQWRGANNERDSACLAENTVGGCVISATKGQSHIGPLLRETDAILSGVDFHCSKVLDDILRSTAVAAKIGAAIHRAAADAGSGQERENEHHEVGFGEEGPKKKVGRVVGVMQAAKQAMWACSGGLNTRSLQVVFPPGNVAVGTKVVSTRGFLKETESADEIRPASEGEHVPDTDTRVWAAMSTDVLEWAGKFVRGRLAPGALVQNDR